MDGTATFCACGQYRYLLTRDLDGRGAPLVFVMLNPSTATAEADDPTIRRCIGFANREGAAQLIVLNLFALRATDPRALAKHAEPIGKRNDLFIRQYAHHRRVVAAWGNGGALNDRWFPVMRLLGEVGADVRCLDVNMRTGQPKHPLYVRGDAPLIPYQLEVAR